MPPDPLNRLLTATHAGVPDAELVRRVADTTSDVAKKFLMEYEDEEVIAG